MFVAEYFPRILHAFFVLAAMRTTIKRHRGNPSRLLKCYESGEFSDAKIVCRGKEFKVHRMVLVTRCQYFRMRIMSPFDPNNVFCFDNLEPDIVDIVLRALYGGKPVVCERALPEVLELAKFWKIRVMQLHDREISAITEIFN